MLLDTVDSGSVWVILGRKNPNKSGVLTTYPIQQRIYSKDTYSFDSECLKIHWISFSISILYRPIPNINFYKIRILKGDPVPYKKKKLYEWFGINRSDMVFFKSNIKV